MNIIYYLKHFPKISESFILNEIYELDRKGHTIAVCAVNKSNTGIQHREFEKLDIPINYLKSPGRTDFNKLFSKKALHPRYITSLLYDVPLERRLANQIRARECIEFIDSLGWQPDIFHAHFASLEKFSAQYAARYYGVPFTITTHAYDLYEKQSRNYTKTLLKRADRIVTISEYNKTNIQKQFTTDTPIDIVRAGIRPEKFEPTQSTKENRILTISRFVEKKGLPYALKAVKIATEQIPNIEYHIIGSGKLKNQLIDIVDQLGIDENVEFLDNVSDQRLVTELDEAQCFLLPCIITDSGDRDGIPVVLMEAMAMKTPPVSTTVSGIPELIDHERNGLLTEPRNPEATAEALIRLLQTDKERKRYAEAARKTVCRDFNIKIEADKLETVFQKA